MTLSNKNGDHLLFILSGSISVSFGQCKDAPVDENELFFLPNDRVFEWKARTDAAFLLSGYNTTFFRCTAAQMDLLYKVKAGMESRCRGTAMKEEVRTVVQQIVRYLEAGINCHHLYMLKYEELYFLFKYCYTSEEVAQIFYPGLKNNLLFNDQVMNNYLQVKTVKELAELLGYSVKTFDKIFKETFDDAPYRWMQKRKALHIRQVLRDPDISLKQIMYDFKFATYSHFNVYCKQYLGATPSQIRNECTENTENSMKG